jgi:hypothetical protein
MIVLRVSIHRPDGKLAAMMIQTQMVLPREAAPARRTWLAETWGVDLVEPNRSSNSATT